LIDTTIVEVCEVVVTDKKDGSIEEIDDMLVVVDFLTCGVERK
jgi:hypothetical protein